MFLLHNYFKVFQSEQINKNDVIYVFPENDAGYRNVDRASNNIKTTQALEIGGSGFKLCTCHLWVGKEKLLNFYEFQCVF